MERDRPPFDYRAGPAFPRAPKPLVYRRRPAGARRPAVAGMAAALYVNDDPNSFVGLLAIMGWPLAV
jgi:hypothetical protein